MESKTQKMISFILNKDYKNALKIAKNFYRGFSKEEIGIIKRAYEMYNYENFYKELGFKKDEEIKKAIIILKRIYKIK